MILRGKRRASTSSSSTSASASPSPMATAADQLLAAATAVGTTSTADVFVETRRRDRHASGGGEKRFQLDERMCPPSSSRSADSVIWMNYSLPSSSSHYISAAAAAAGCSSSASLPGTSSAGITKSQLVGSSVLSGHARLCDSKPATTGVAEMPRKVRSGDVPLPHLSWADRDDVWNEMCLKDVVYSRDPHYLQNHISLQPRMRSILLDWLSEVCEVYKLHRETFHLAVDYTDRYLSREKNVPKSRLQLVGITALFIAAKMEEIYPPKLSDFAYVTDGACSEELILEQEVLILKCLHWKLTPVSVNHWLITYLQILCQFYENARDQRYRSDDFLFPHFQRHYLLRLSQLADFCLLDIGSLQFPYGVLAASVFAHVFEPQYVALHVSGFNWADIAECYQWMTPFAQVIKEFAVSSPKYFSDVPADDVHNIQIHNFDLTLLDRAQMLQQEIARQSHTSPVLTVASPLGYCFPTPPPSEERPRLNKSLTAARTPSD